MRFFYFASLCLALLSPSTAFPHASGHSASSDASAVAEKISVSGISNMGKVSGSLFRGAQPHLSSLDELKKLGITTIVDLRSASDQLRDDERARAEALGIHFVSIPLGGFSIPTAAQLAEFFALLRQTPAPKIFIHCQFGADRTGVFVAAYRIAFQHWSSDAALSEMHRFGFHNHWHPGMSGYVRALPALLQSDPTLKAALLPN
jgi:protein tyrosine/serine phosphatase